MSFMPVKTVSRQSAEERREQVLEAATHEFAQRGYHGAGTAAIAERAGISQPYIYALFPNKKELFLAAHGSHGQPSALSIRQRCSRA